MIDHPEPVGLVGIDEIARPEKLFRLANAKLPELGRILVVGTSPAHGAVREPGSLGCHHKIAGGGEHPGTHDAVAADHGDGGLGNLAPAPAHAKVLFLLARVEQLCGGLVGVRRHHQALVELGMQVAPRSADIMPGREMLALARQHDAAHRIVIRRALEGVVQRIGHLPVLGIVEAGPSDSASSGFIRLSSALAQSDSTNVVLDNSATLAQDILFIEVTDPTVAITGALVQDAALPSYNTNSDSWEDHGTGGGFSIHNFDTDIDKLAFMDQSGQRMFDFERTEGVVGSTKDIAASDNGKMFVFNQNNVVYGGFDSISAVRETVARVIDSASANSEFAVMLFEASGTDSVGRTTYDAGFFKVNVVTGVDELESSNDFSVLPLARIANIDTNAWANSLTGTQGIAPAYMQPQSFGLG